MLVIKNIKDLEKYKKDDFLNKEGIRVVHFCFNEDITFDISLNLYFNSNNKIHYVFFGKNIIFNKNCLINNVYAKENIFCKSNIFADLLSAKKDIVLDKIIECENIESRNILGGSVSTNNLFVKNKIILNQLTCKNISNFKKLKVNQLCINGTLLLNTSALCSL